MSKYYYHADIGDDEKNREGKAGLNTKDSRKTFPLKRREPCGKPLKKYILPVQYSIP
jgi:hypothetical protein